MNWLGDMLFNAPQSSARSERAKRSGSQPRSGSRSRDEEDAEVSGRIHSMVHNGQGGEMDDDDDDVVDAATGVPINNGASDDDGEEEEEEEDEEDEEEEEEEDATSAFRSSSSRSAAAMNDDDDDASEEDEEEEDEEAAEDDEEGGEEDDEDVEEEEEEEEEVNLASMTVAELKDLLHKKGLPTSGTKAELVSRLTSFDSFGDHDGDHAGGGSSSSSSSSSEVALMSKSLERSMGAAKEASDLFTLNERLHDILENEAHKDKAVGKVKSELKALRAMHSEDLSDLSFEKDVTAVRKRAGAGASAFSEATEEEDRSLQASLAKLKKTETLEEQVAEDNAAYKKELQEVIAQGDALAAKITKLAAATAATITKTNANKSRTTVSEAWSHLFETALGGIATEVEKHDLQRDSMVEKLRSIIADVSDENSDQVLLMERHSRDIIAEAKAHLSATFESRSHMLKDKYGRLRKLLEAQHDAGDDALAKHQAFLEDHYAKKYDEKHESLRSQADILSSQVNDLADEEEALVAQVKELEEEAKERDIATKAKEKQAKKVQAEVTALHGTIGTLRDDLYDARAALEDAERKERAVEVDYEILMTENTHLTEEIDKFGEMVQRAEKALSSSSSSSSSSSGGSGGLAAISEYYQTPKAARSGKSGMGGSGSSGGAKAKRKSPSSAPAAAKGGRGKGGSSSSSSSSSSGAASPPGRKGTAAGKSMSAGKSPGKKAKK